MSIVVPVRDMSEHLRDCLAALARQDHRSYEVIVVDNGSTDASREVAREFPVTLLEEATPGAAAARNCGIRAARGAIVAFTDADCVPSRGWVRGLATAMDDPEVTVAAGGMEPLPGGESLIGTYARLIGQYGAEATLSHARFPYAPTACMAVRKRVLEEAGLFDPSFLTYEGADLFYRIHRLGLLRHAISRRAVILFRTRSDTRAFIRQNYRYGQGYGRFCYRYREALDPGRLRVAGVLGGWRSRVASGFGKLTALDESRTVRRRLLQLHLARETAQALGILHWRRLGPPEPGER